MKKLTKLQNEILARLAERPQSLLGLEDRCDEWKTPDQLVAELGALLVYGFVGQLYDHKRHQVDGFCITSPGREHLARLPRVHGVAA